MTISWWRSWHGAPTDLKWQVIAARSGVKAGIVSAIAWALFDYASQRSDRGSVEGFDVETYAVYSGFSEEEVNAVIEVMRSKGVITNNRLTAWDKRQPKREDDSYNRVARYRELKRSVTQSNQCNAPEKEKDTDKDKDKDKESALDSFSVLQRIIEVNTGYPPSGKNDSDAIIEMVNMQATEPDIQNAVAWFVGQGKTVRHYSSLVQPVKVEIAKRKQNGRAHAPTTPPPANEEY